MFSLLRKPESPALLGKRPQSEASTTQLPFAPRASTPSGFRNFSYPTSIASSSSQTPPVPTATPDLSAWNQAGEICSFSLESPARSPEGTFFFRGVYGQHRERSHEEASRSPRRSKLTRFGDALGDPKLRKKQRRSTLLGLSASQSHASLFSKDKGKHEEKRIIAPEGETSSEQGYSPSPNIAARLKRVGKHKATSSLDASYLVKTSQTAFNRPSSSFGVTTVDTRLRSSGSRAELSLLSVSNGQGHEEPSKKPGQKSSTFEVSFTNHQKWGLHSAHRKSVSQVSIGQSSSSGRIPGNWASEVDQRSSRDGKMGWLTQFRDWFTVSEPSTQALGQHRNGKYKRVGISRDDPQAHAKLHMPCQQSPENIIRPAGPRPDPAYVRKQSVQNEKLRQPHTNGFRGSRSNSVQHTLVEESSSLREVDHKSK